MRFGGGPKRLVGVEYFVEFEMMGNQLLRIDFVGLQYTQEHRSADCVYQPGGDRDVAVPEILQMKIYFGAMHTDIGDHPARCDNFLAELECRRDANCLYGGVNPAPIRHL